MLANRIASLGLQLCIITFPMSYHFSLKGIEIYFIAQKVLLPFFLISFYFICSLREMISSQTIALLFTPFPRPSLNVLVGINRGTDICMTLLVISLR